MKISERKLRRIVRSALLQELTNFGYSMQLKSSRERACPYYVFGWDAKSTRGPGGYDNESIQKKVRDVLSSKSGQEIKEKLLKQFPGLKNDLAVIDGSLDQLTTYALNYSYVTGTGCLEYYFLSKALDLMAFILGGVDPAGANELRNDVQSGQPVIKWTSALEERASSMAPGSIHGFMNVMPFYCLPNLAKEGPNVANVDLLKADLENYQERLNNVLAYNTTDLNSAFLNISEDMDIQDTKVIRAINMESVDIPVEDINKMKKEAAGSLVAALGEALLNYSAAREDNPEFDNVCKEFFSKNTLFT